MKGQEPPFVFTRQIRETIKKRLSNDPEALAYVEELEAIALASDVHIQAQENVVTARIGVTKHLVRVNFLK